MTKFSRLTKFRYMANIHQMDASHKPQPFENPFRPGAGQMPPYLAGRSLETDKFKRLLQQTIVMENAILTGLRGVGKSVLLASLKPLALAEGWLWVGTDWSESASVSEDNLATRILADIALVTSPLVVREARQYELGFTSNATVIRKPLDYDILESLFRNTPGLVSDKLKSVLEFLWSVLPQGVIKGVVFAYDEAQNLADHAGKEQYPLSVLIEKFQSIQRKEIPMMLVLTGLPTLFPKLIKARTYSERMFDVMTLRPLDNPASKEAIVNPTLKANCPIHFSAETVNAIADMSGGYPYFIQFICREVYDVWISKIQTGEVASVPTGDIIRKLDSNFFQGRWGRATDRQKEMLQVIATLENCDGEFTVQDVVNGSKTLLARPFKPSNANLMLAALCDAELVYKNRFGKYLLAVPLLSQFILRQTAQSVNLPVR